MLTKYNRYNYNKYNGLKLLLYSSELLILTTASTCALTIGLNLCWAPRPELFKANHDAAAKFSKDEGDNIKAIMYLIAITWSQWSGTLVHYFGSYYLITFGVIVSLFGGVVVSVTPFSIYWLYFARALQGFGCASLAVAIPNYIVDSIKGLYQSEYKHFDLLISRQISKR